MVGANGAGKSTLINALRRLVARRADRARRRCCSTACRSDGLRAASPCQRTGCCWCRRARASSPSLTVEENLALVRPPADTDRPARLLHGRDLRPVPAPAPSGAPQGRHALGRRAADGGGEPRAAGRAARPAARRAIGRPRAAARLRAAGARCARWSIAACRCCWSSRTCAPPSSSSTSSICWSAARSSPTGTADDDERRSRASSRPISGASPHEPRCSSSSTAWCWAPATRCIAIGWTVLLGRRAAGQLRAWPALHAGRLRRLVRHDQARRAATSSSMPIAVLALGLLGVAAAGRDDAAGDAAEPHQPDDRHAGLRLRDHRAARRSSSAAIPQSFVSPLQNANGALRRASGSPGRTC